jgi:hypothetical protein
LFLILCAIIVGEQDAEVNQGTDVEVV